MNKDGPEFLGRGWRFPPEFVLSPDSSGTLTGPGTTAMIAGDADIQESLAILFSTFRGGRVLALTYGIGIEGHVFDIADETQLGDLRSQIEQAIKRLERRVWLTIFGVSAAVLSETITGFLIQ